MTFKAFQNQIIALGLHVSHSQHGTWLVTVSHRFPHSRASIEVTCAEISVKYRSYFVTRPQYISKPAILMIHRFASTPKNERYAKRLPQPRYVLMLVRPDGRIQDWYINPHKQIESVIGMERRFISNKRYHLSTMGLIHIENYLLKHGIGKQSMLVKPLKKE